MAKRGPGAKPPNAKQNARLALHFAPLQRDPETKEDFFEPQMDDHRRRSKWSFIVIHGLRLS